MKPILLASASPRRKEILQNAGIPFEVEPSRAEELKSGRFPPDVLVAENALQKASEVAARHPGRIVLGADTLVAIGDDILGKPKDREDAFRMIRALAGRTHRVLTGVSLVCGEKVMTDVEETTVRFRELTDDQIRAYVATGECDDKAGAYGIQGRGGVFVERIEGDYFNVVGLPLCKVNRMLETFFREMPIDK